MSNLHFFLVDSVARNWFLKSLDLPAGGSSMEVEGATSNSGVSDGEALPEIEAYLGILVLVHLVDSKKNASVRHYDD